MNITGIALRNRVTVTVALLVIVLAGLSAYRGMPRDEDPGFIIRWAQVVTHYPGANPERMELLISDKLEKAIQEMPELKNVTSQNRTGVSIIMVEIKARHREMRPIWDDLRRKVDKVRPQLPEGVIGPTVNDEFGDVSGIVTALTGEGYSYAELKRVADQIRDELLRVPDVAKVTIHGAQKECIFVEYENARLARLGLSPYALLDLLKRRNIVIPGGFLETGHERIALEPSGNFESLAQIGRTVVGIPGRKELLHLDDIVRIRRGYAEPPAEKMRYNGRASLGIAISMREGGNMVQLGARVRPLLRRLEQAYPWGIKLSPVAFQPDVVTAKIDEFVTSLVQAVVIVILVMLIFLGLRTGLVVAALIPVAIVMAILVMSQLKIGLNQMSLASLMIALGLLVDNAIVMAESIMVQMERGKKAVDAALSAAKELRVPLLVSSLTTAAAFLPIYLAESDVGEYTAPLFSVVTITLLCSWVLAMTMTPLLCVVFLKVSPRPEGQGPALDGRLYRAYRWVLLGMLRRRAISLGVVVLVFFGVMSLMRYVPAIFFPAMESTTFLGDLKLPAGSPIERTERVVKELDRFIAKELAAGHARKAGIANWTAYIGNGGPKFRLAYNVTPPDSSYAALLFNATHPELVAGLQQRLARWCQRRFPDLQANFKDLEYGPPVSNPVEVRILGRTEQEIFARADQVKAFLRKVPGTRNIEDNWGRPAKKLLVRVDQSRARMAGITNEDIAVSLRTIFAGIDSTGFREADKVIPISLRSVATDRQDLGKLETLNVYSQRSGQTVPLKQVADTEMQWDPGKILRKNRFKSVTVSSQLQPGYLAQDVFKPLRPWLQQQSKTWGVGTKYELGGKDKASEEANASINAKLPLAGFLILMLLVSQFNGVRKPLIILTTIPLALIGVVLGLLVTGSYMGFMTFLGIISLAGIVINNAIVLLDRIRIELDAGRSPQQAVVTAAEVRMRPILLTTVTTMGGLIPLWLGGGPMWEPMAIAIIFGLMFATVLTLGFVPLFYSLLFRVNYKGFVPGR